MLQRASATASRSPVNDGVLTRSAATSLATTPADSGISDLTLGALGTDTSTTFTVVDGHVYGPS